MPKRGCDLNKCEVTKFFKLHPKGFVEVISFTVPRKSTLFQDDIFPDTKDFVPVITAEEWIAGENRNPKMMSLKDNFVQGTRQGVATMKASAASKAASGSGVTSAVKKAPAASKPAGAAAPAGGASDKEVAALKKKVAELEAENEKLKKKVASSDKKIKQLQQMLQ